MSFDPPIPLPQSREYVDALTLLGTINERLTLRSGAFEAGHAQMQSRWFPGLGWLGLVSRGPLWAGHPDIDALAGMVQDLGHPLVLNAEGITAAELIEIGFVQVMTRAVIARMNLIGGENAIRARMHQKWRNRYMVALNSPLSTGRVAMPDDPDHWLLSAEGEQRRSRRYNGLPVEFATAYTRANPGQAQLFTAYLRNEPVAAMLFLRHGNAATYHIGHTTELGRTHNAHTRLLGDAAIWLSEMGVDVLELGPLDTQNAPGLARFKLGSGARAYPLGGTWLYSRWLAPVARTIGPTLAKAA